METPDKVLVLFAHPVLHKSRVNRQLIEAVRDLPGITVHDLYEAYPDFAIDVKREQQLLTQHQVIVLHHPFYWYSCPALVKEWIDLVLEYNFAFGIKGTALRGKWFMTAITTGGGPNAYGAGSMNSFTVREFLNTFEQTAIFCGMRYLPPFVVQGTHILNPPEIEKYADLYRETLTALRDRRLSEQIWKPHAFMNSALDSLRAGTRN